MSNKKVRTALDGYERQLFPEKLDELNKVYDEVGSNGFALEKSGTIIDGYELRDRPTTKDRYTWFWGLHFRTEKGKIATLFPWAQDWDKRDGIQLDRSIAIYTKGKVDTQDVDSLIEKLYQGFLVERKKETPISLQSQ
ncbi:MAG: hypothetical protein V1802_02330 [Candidatus Aenigmatarchaeota archaeon]